MIKIGSYFKNKGIYIFLSLITIFFVILFIFLPRIGLVKSLNFSNNNYYNIYKNSDIFFNSVLLLLCIFIFYIFVFVKNHFTNIQFRVLFLFSVFINIFSLIVFPIFSSDIFYYIFSARIFSIHHLSPFLTPYYSLQADTFYYILKDHNWAMYPSIYGSLFTLGSSLITIIFSNNLFWSIISFKFIAIIFNIINGYLIYLITKSKKAYFLYAFNPFVILELCINSHNEVFQVFFILLAFFYLFTKSGLKSYFFATLFLTFSILIKATSFIFLPIFLIFIFCSIKEKKKKSIFIILSCATVFLFSFISYLPFHTNIKDIIYPIIFQLNLPAILFLSPGIIILNKFIYFFKQDNALKLSIIINKIAFFLFYGYLLIISFFRKNKNYKECVLEYSTIIFLVFLLTFFKWLMPWYFIPLIILCILSYSALNKKTYLVINYMVTFCGIVYYLILR